MGTLVPRFSSFTTMRNESRPRRISQHIAYRGEAEVAALAFSRGGVSQLPLLPDMLSTDEITSEGLGQWSQNRSFTIPAQEHYRGNHSINFHSNKLYRSPPLQYHS